MSDLDAIYEYIALEIKNPDTAAALIDRIAERLLQLESFPESCPVTERTRDKGYRKLIIDKYVAVYEIRPNKKTVVILRVFYGMSDYEKDL